MIETWRRRGLYFAGSWNLIGGAAALLDPAGHLAQMYSSTLPVHEPLPAFFFRATWINVMAWGLAYVLAGRLPASRTPILIAGAVGKLAYALACAALVAAGGGTSLLVAAGAADVLFALFFCRLALQPGRTPTGGAQ